MTDIIIPPDIMPTTENVELIDDQTQVFRPAFGPALAQRVQYAAPRVRVTQTWKSLRQSDKARMMAAVNGLRGKYNTIRALVGYALRGTFPATELLSNNTFANGTTGWSADTYASLSVSDRVLRVSRTAGVSGGNNGAFQSNVAITQYAPYLVRAHTTSGAGNSGKNIFATDGVVSVGASITGDGLVSGSKVFTTSTLNSVEVYDAPSVNQAGDFFSCPYISLTRCALIDNGTNALLYSDQFDNAAWSPLGATIVPNGNVAPDGTSTADRLVETGATSAHCVIQALTVPAAVNDFCFSVAVQQITRGWCSLRMDESGGGTVLVGYFNLATGALGASNTVGAGWANLRMSASSLGSGWWQLTMAGRKTTSGATINAYVMSATADGTNSYTGTLSTVAIIMWRATLAQSSTAVRLVQTTSAATTGTAQTGNSLNIKGLPASTNGLLLPGDPFEINGELKICTAALNSDASQLGVLKFEPALVRSPADNDPMVIATPLGKFVLVENPKWTNQFGTYADLTLVMEAIYE